MGNKRRLIILVVIFIIGLGVIVFSLTYFSRSSKTKEKIDSVSVIKDGKQLRVNSDGSVIYITEDDEYEDNWSLEKTQAYFNYFSENYSGETQIVRSGQNVVTVVINGQTYTYILGEDEIVDAASDDAIENDTGNGGSNGEDEENDLNQYFSPVPAPTSNYSPTPTPTPYNGGGSFMDECLFWRLSYCVIPKPPAPTANPSPSGSPDPNANVIQVNNCGQYVEEGYTHPTVISNTLCLPER